MSREGTTAGDHVGKSLERIAKGILTLDSELQVRHLNGAGEGLLGLDGEAVQGKPLETVLAGESALVEQVRTAREAGTETTFETALDAQPKRIEGTIYPGEDGVTVVFDGVAKQRADRDDRAAVLERFLAVASDRDLSDDEKIEQLLSLGRAQLGTVSGFLTRIEAGTQEIIHSVGDNPDLDRGNTVPLSRAYCRRTLEADDPLAVDDAPAEGWEADPAYEEFDLDCYVGTTLYVDGEEYGTLCFADREPRDSAFDEYELTLVELLADWIRHFLEEQAYERELEQQQAFTESLINSLPDPLYAFEEDGTILRWNDRLEAVTGYDPAEIESMDPVEFVVESDRDRVRNTMQGVWDGERRSVEATVQTSDDEEIPYELSGAPLRDEDGEIVGVAGTGRDVTERNAHRERLSRILETTRSFMQARDRQHVGELAVNAASELLGEDAAVFRLYDSEEGVLSPIASTEAVSELMGDRPVYEVGVEYPGEVFASGEPRIVADLDAEDRDTGYGEIRSAMYYPVGVHGTIAIGSTEPDAFDGTDQQVLALLSTSAAAACTRAKQMREVREAREHTERVLERVNGLVQNTIEVLVQATTREELEAGVVRELAATEPYTFAWIGQPDVATETLSPTAWDGDVGLPIEGRTFDLQGGGEPVSDAYRERTTQVCTDVTELYGPWADVVADSDVDGFVTIPLAYKDATYGVLSVCAADSEVFDERERVVLDALGRAVANAINAIERGRILDATEIIELEFAVDDPDLLFSRLSTGCRLESAGTDYRSDGRLRLYLTATGADSSALVDAARQDPQVSEVTCIVEHDDECLLELLVEESLLETLTEYGAVPRELVAEDGTTRFTVELPYETEARELFELVEDQYPGTDLLGYHERERPVETRQDFKAALSDRLTDRQETALRTAYLGGFFDWPREIDGNELAGAMDISRPTYHQHLRTAQAKVFEELFE